MNILLIGVWSTLLILVVLVIILLIRTRSGRLSGSAGYGGGGLPRELREEMYRSRQETIGMVQSSVKNMGDMLSQAQRESMELHSRRGSEKSPLKREDPRDRGRDPAGGYLAADPLAGTI